MRQVDFKKVKGLEGVATYFYGDTVFLKEIVDSHNQFEFYEELKIRKKNYKNRNKHRVVYKAVQPLSQLQKNIAHAINENTQFPDCVQGFVKKRSSYSNAKQHLARKLLLNADITDFFDTIKISQVISIFENLGCDNETAKVLAKVCTLNGVLSQGLHTSPVISNLVVAEMDEDFQNLCGQHNAVYTRYADDISISSNTTLPNKEAISDLLSEHGFQLNTDKFRISKRGQSQYVTGLSVFDSEQPRVPKRMKRRLRLELHYIDKYGLLGHFEEIEIPDFAQSYCYNRIRGHLDYINAIEPDLAEKLYPKLPHKPNYKRIAKTLKEDPEKLPESIKLDLGLKKNDSSV